jgi:hypothetical protein
MIFLQIVQSFTNLLWKFLLSSPNAKAKYWYINIFDGLLFSLVMGISGLYIMMIFDLWLALNSWVASIKWQNKRTQKLEKFSLFLVVSIILVLGFEIHFGLEFFAALFFTIGVLGLKDKNRFGWLAILVGHILVLYPMYLHGAKITALTQLISIVFAIRGFISWKSTRIFFRKGYILVYSTFLVRFFGRFISLGAGAFGITLYPCIFIREDFKNQGFDSELILHEEIHIAQQRELLVFGAFFLYLYEYLYARFFLRLSARDAYYYTATEQEAHRNAHVSEYLHHRKPYAVFWYMNRKNKKHLSRGREGVLVEDLYDIV